VPISQNDIIRGSFRLYRDFLADSEVNEYWAPVKETHAWGIFYRIERLPCTAWPPEEPLTVVRDGKEIECQSVPHHSPF